MYQDNIRQQVKHLKTNGINYRQMAQGIGINQSSFYSWLYGQYNLKESTAQRLEEWIKQKLIEQTPRGKKYRTVRNLISLLEQYTFQEGEELKPLPKYDNNIRYYITNYGNVFSLCGNEWIKKVPQYDTDGYLYVDIYCNGDRTRKRIHQLVFETFEPQIDLSDKEIHHINQDKTDNRLINLIAISKEKHALIHKYLSKWGDSYAELDNTDLLQLESSENTQGDL